MELGIIGTSIWQQNMSLLERLTIDREKKIELLQELKSFLGLHELVYLATCNRVEFLYTSGTGRTDGHLLHRLIDFFFRESREINFFPNDFYHYTDKEAITHLFRTVASLESLVVGETQITGQFKEAIDASLEAGLAGTYLEKLGSEALLVAKRVKRETDLGNGSLSMASLAVAELTAHLKGSEERVIALVGSGEMTVKVARYVTKSSLGRLMFVNRTEQTAIDLAKDLGGTAMSLRAFVEKPPVVDAIVSSTASPDPIFDRNFLDRLPGRSGPVLCIDLAIPRDFAAGSGTSQDVRVIDIPYLKSRAQGSLRRKFVEASKANEIVKQSVHRFLSDRLEGSMKPIFHSSYQESVELARRALDDLFAKKVTTLSEEDKQAIYNLVTKLIGHSAFQPAKRLSDRLIQSQPQLDIETRRAPKETT